MNSSTSSTCRDQSDGDVLQILLQLSHVPPSEWAAQFPFLDPTAVSQVSNSITHVLRNEKTDLQRLLVPLLRKWCSGSSQSSSTLHSAWIGRCVSVEECVDSVLLACIPIIENEEDWSNRDMEQQLALCYAILGAATNSSSRLRIEAGEMCAVLLKRIVNQNILEPLHHRFLAQLWDSVGGLPIDDRTLTQMAECSILGFERTMLWLGEKALNSNQQTIAESFDTVVGCKLLVVCSESPKVFQNVCNLLTHMMVVSEAHPGILALTKAFILGVERQCRLGRFDICSLYEEPCQVVSALMCVDPSLLPEHGEKVLSRQTVLNMLNNLPQAKAACLLSHRPAWLLFTF